MRTEQEMYHQFLATYTDADVEHIWQATFIMCKLFDRVANEVASKLGYHYNQLEAEASLNHLKHVYQLPKEATQIY